VRYRSARWGAHCHCDYPFRRIVCTSAEKQS
jgi:hypothetical protein